MTPITLRGIRKLFGKITAVDGIGLDIAAGDLFFLLGPSGCGKTTLLRILAGFTEPNAGTVHFADRDVTRLPPNKRNTGMVFQGYALWPHMTVAQNVAFGLDVRRISNAEKSQRVDAALQSVQMFPLAQRKPNELSGGQQQRVALARALVVEPTVLLLDEPLSNLDARLRLEMRSQIRDICKNAGITAVYVTHDQKEALSMADRLAVMHEGRLVQVGTPRDVYEKPVSRFVADFMGLTNFINAEVVGREGAHVIVECPAGRLRCGIAPADLPPTGNVTCCIRPEAVRIVRNGDQTANQFQAHLTRVVYLGEVAQHQLILPGAVPLIALELNPRPLPTDKPLTISFDPADVVILPD